MVIQMIKQVMQVMSAGGQMRGFSLLDEFQALCTRPANQQPPPPPPPSSTPRNPPRSPPTHTPPLLPRPQLAPRPLTPLTAPPRYFSLAHQVCDGLYIVLKGKLDVSLNGKTVDTLKQGSCIGEQSMLTGLPANRTVPSLSFCELYRLRRPPSKVSDRRCCIGDTKEAGDV